METPKTGGEDDDMGVVGAEADDAEAEFIRNVCEKEIMYGSTLLASICPVITSICSQPNKYPDPELRASASLALSKFMLVSSEFCEQNLQLVRMEVVADFAKNLSNLVKGGAGLQLESLEVYISPHALSHYHLLRSSVVYV